MITLSTLSVLIFFFFFFFKGDSFTKKDFGSKESFFFEIVFIYDFYSHIFSLFIKSLFNKIIH